MSQENVERVRRAFDALNRRDLDAFLGFMDPEGEFTTRFLQMEGGTEYRGHDGLREWWEDLLAVFPDLSVAVLEAWDERRLEAEEFIDAGDCVATRLRHHGRGKGSGVEIDEELYHQVATFRDGRIVRMEYFAEWEEAVEAAGLGEQEKT